MDTLSKHNEHMIATECKYVGMYVAWPIVTDKIFAETKNCTNIVVDNEQPKGLLII